LIENADKILNPFLKGMIKTAMQSPENAKLLENADAMEFFMSGVKERHPDNAEAILKELENIK
jgi:hypothetical protein